MPHYTLHSTSYLTPIFRVAQISPATLRCMQQYVAEATAQESVHMQPEVRPTAQEIQCGMCFCYHYGTHVDILIVAHQVAKTAQAWFSRRRAQYAQAHANPSKGEQWNAMPS